MLVGTNNFRWEDHIYLLDVATSILGQIVRTDICAYSSFRCCHTFQKLFQQNSWQCCQAIKCHQCKSESESRKQERKSRRKLLQLEPKLKTLSFYATQIYSAEVSTLCQVSLFHCESCFNVISSKSNFSFVGG